MSAHVTVRLGLTLTEARALASWLDLAAIIERTDWNGERAVTRHRLAAVETRVRHAIRQAEDDRDEEEQ